MISGDEENPDLQQIPSEMPSEDYPEPEPPREFLNSESPESVLPGEELPSPDGILGDGTSNPLPEQDPDASLEEILASESFPEGVEVLPEPEPVPLPQVPTFQIRLGPISGEAKPLLKKFLEAQTISLSEKVWASPSPVISQLTEFQAIALYQNARALGIFAEAQIVLPHSPIPSEDDLALGDLSAIPDPIPVETHSAPSVNLPRGERDVILCTMDTLPGLSLIENFGIVAAHRTIPRRLFREDDLRQKLEKELRAVPNRAQASLPASHFQALLRDLLFDLQKAALSKGANSVLGIRLEAFSEFASKDPRLEQLRLVAIGTAAVVEKAE